MPTIDVYAAAGTFQNGHELAQNLAAAFMRWAQVPPPTLFEEDTAAFVHDFPEEATADDGDSNYVRVHVLTPVLDRDKQLGVVEELTDIIAAAARDPAAAERTWVLITESPERGWAVAGHASATEDLASGARRER